MNNLFLNSGKVLDFQTISQMYQTGMYLNDTNTSINLGTLTFNLHSPQNLVALNGIVNYNLSINVPNVSTAIIGPITLNITRNGNILKGKEIYHSAVQYTHRSMLTNSTEYDSPQYISFEFVDNPVVPPCNSTVTYTLTMTVPDGLTPGVEYQFIRNEIYYSFSGAEIQQ